MQGNRNQQANITMLSKNMNPAAVIFRLGAILLIAIGAAFTRPRVGDWFFRSEIFSEQYATLLMIMRLASAAAGLALLIFAGKLGGFISDWLRKLSEPGRLAVLTLALACTGFIIFASSVLLRNNMVMLKPITNYQAVFKVLGFDLIIQTDELRTSDFLTCFFFILAGTVSFVMFGLHRLGLMKHTDAKFPSTRIMWLIFSLGYYFLAMDEYFGIHELIGDNIAFIDKIKLTHHPDDMIIGSYFIVALAVIIRFKDYLLGCKRAVAMLITGVLLHVTATGLDAFVNFYFLEEGFEMLAMAFYFSAMAQYALNEILQGGA